MQERKAQKLKKKWKRAEGTNESGYQNSVIQLIKLSSLIQSEYLCNTKRNTSALSISR
jgi:hypothetical protein